MHAIHGHPRGGVAVIDYAHTPDALATALASLRPETEGQLGVVFGCGGDRDKGKRNERVKSLHDWPISPSLPMITPAAKTWW